MLACYVPEPPPVMADNADRMGQHILLYRRYWLVIHWSGMQTPNPHIDWAYVHDTADRYYVRVAPERLTVLSRCVFTDWYHDHWQRFMKKASGQ